MLDLIYTKAIIDLLIGNGEYSLLTESKEAFKSVDSSLSRSDIDIELKYMIDVLIQKFGLIGSLEKLSDLNGQLKHLPEESDIFRHLPLLYVALQSTYENIENYYLTDLSQKLKKAVVAIIDGSFDVDKFLAYIFKDSTLQAQFFMPPKESIANSVQTALNGFNSVNSYDSEIDIYTSILNENWACLIKNIRSMKKALKGEFYNNLANLIDLIANSSHPRSTMISNSVMKLGEISYEIVVKPKCPKLESIYQSRFNLH